MAESSTLGQLWQILSADGTLAVPEPPMLPATRVDCSDALTAISGIASARLSYSPAAYWSSGAWRPTISITPETLGADPRLLVPGNPPELRAVPAMSADLRIGRQQHNADEVIAHLVRDVVSASQQLSALTRQGWTPAKLAKNPQAVAFVTHIAGLVNTFNQIWRTAAVDIPAPVALTAKAAASDWLPSAQTDGMDVG